MTCGEAESVRAMRAAVSEAARARRWRVLRPRCASQQSKGEGTAPMAFCRKVRRSLISGELKAAAPIRTSEWPLMYFVTLWMTMSAP